MFNIEYISNSLKFLKKFDNNLMERIIIIKPSEFLSKIEKADELYSNRSLSSFEDCLMAVLFLSK